MCCDESLQFSKLRFLSNTVFSSVLRIMNIFETVTFWIYYANGLEILESGP